MTMNSSDNMMLQLGALATLALFGYLLYLASKPGSVFANSSTTINENALGDGVFDVPASSAAIGPVPPVSPKPEPVTTAPSDFAVQSSEPAVPTTTAAPSTQPAPQVPKNPNTIAPVVPGIRNQPRQSKPFFPLPAEHPYDPAYPIPFPNPKYDGGVPPGGTPITNPPAPKPPMQYKPPYSESPNIPTPKPTKEAGGSPYEARVIPNTLPPTVTNQYKIDSTSVTEMPTQCPVMPPKGKLELAIKAWTNGKHSGPVTFEDGDVDMGRDGGWWDGDNSGCCDHYCRRVGPKGGEYWSCITPQAPYNEYTHMKPKGHQCHAFAGAPIAK